MKLGIVGLPNVGKSTLFNAITQAGAECANYPFCTIEPNVGVVAVPDERVRKLHEIYDSKKTTFATIEFCDIAGLVKGASKGEGLGNQFLGHIREVDAIIHVVRCFENENIIHVDGHIDPASDIDTINTELILSDMEILERRIGKVKSGMKGGNKAQAGELAIMERIMEGLGEGRNARSLSFDADELPFVESIGLLSYKPIIYVANVDEDDAPELSGDLTGASADSLEAINPYVAEVKRIAQAENSQLVAVCASLEEEISQLEDEEKQEFISDLGLAESGLDRLIKASYSLLKLISFLTAGADECRAWTIKEGTKAPQAAGKIHTDFERGFIRAETIAYDKFMEVGGSMASAREKGFLRSEGKDYVMKDGDIVNFLFNV